jgi:hypothetical protein
MFNRPFSLFALFNLVQLMPSLPLQRTGWFECIHLSIFASHPSLSSSQKEGKTTARGFSSGTLKILSIINWPRTADIDCDILSPKLLATRCYSCMNEAWVRGRVIESMPSPNARLPPPFPSAGVQILSLPIPQTPIIDVPGNTCDISKLRGFRHS